MRLRRSKNPLVLAINHLGVGRTARLVPPWLWDWAVVRYWVKDHATSSWAPWSDRIER